MEHHERVWYGWQTLTIDLAAGALTYLTLSATPEDSEFTGLGVATLVLGAPIVHLAHGQDSALGSLGLRLLLPVAGGFIGAELAGSCSPTATDCAKWSPLGWVAGGAIVGLVTASVLDATLLAYEEPRSKAAPTARLGFSPVLSVDGKQFGFRLFGAF